MGVTKYFEGQRKRILLVDDNDAVRRVLGAMLRIDGGFEVDTAANGAFALDMLRKNDYNILLLDVNMPVMNGIQLYHSIVKEYPESARRVVFMSADTFNPKKINRPFLSNPFSIDELMSIYRTSIEGHGTR